MEGAKYFAEKGYDVITFDRRSSDENSAEKTAYGCWENMMLLININD